jgi:hypothetical protein
MGIHAQIEPAERGDTNRVSDPRGHFAKILATMALQHTSCVRFIDHFGETLFNALQLPVLLDELEALASVAKDDEARAHVQRLSALVRRALSKGSHHFVRFIGD